MVANLKMEQACRRSARCPLLPPNPPHAADIGPISCPAHISERFELPLVRVFSDTQHDRPRTLTCALPRMQDHKVFARHNKWGTFQVPKAFLNTNAPAAVAPKAVRQARCVHACSLPGTPRVAPPTRRLAKLIKVL